MAKNWIDILGKINKSKGIPPGSAVPVDHILQAMSQSGMTDAQINKIIAAFMSIHATGTDVATSDVAQVSPLNLTQIISMLKDPAQHDNLVKLWNQLSDDQKQSLENQIKNLKPTQDPQKQNLEQKVLDAIDKIQSIANMSIPKRTKMLDVIQVLNSILPSPIMAEKDSQGTTYSQKLQTVLNQNTDKFGTTATPAAQYVKLISASIQQNKKIELPQAALEHRIMQLSKVLQSR